MTLLEILDDISRKEETFMHVNTWGPSLAFRDNFANSCYFTLKKESDDLSILEPINASVNTYYRGESDIYKPSKASIFRGDSNELYLDLLRFEEFKILLDTHPAVKFFKSGIDYKVLGHVQHASLKVDYRALAQHYGIRTADMDFTSDKWVAAFFAATDYADGRYTPHTSGGEGQFYYYSPNSVLIENPFYQKPVFTPVGAQPFNRPTRQRGFVLETNKECDLNNYPNMTVYRFRHDASVNEMIYNYNNCSVNLFPIEILSEKVNQLYSTKIFSREAYNNFVNRYNFPKGVFNKALDKIKFTGDPPVSFSQKEIDEYNCYWNSVGRDAFYSQIIFPFGNVDVKGK